MNTQPLPNNDAPPPPANVNELEELLSRPTAQVISALERVRGDIAVLGASGKMGPSLCRMLARALHEMGDERKVLAVARFTERHDRTFALPGIPGSELITAVRCDLANADEIARLPQVPNLIFMAGQKFGSSRNPSQTWGMNALVPALAATHFKGARKVVFSTGNVYPLVPVESGGATEGTEPSPVGEYAQSCLARERIFEFQAQQCRAPTLIFRLNYAVDLRYGVLVDIAHKVWSGEPVSLSMSHVNVIWQGDANAFAIAALAQCSVPPTIMNVTGTEVLAVRDIAEEFGRAFGKTPRFVDDGVDTTDALLSNSSRLQSVFGAAEVSESTLIKWVAAWIASGQELLGKATHFEVRSGEY